MTDVMLKIAGEEIHLLAERALWWPNASTLIVADLHWGKASTFRAAGIPIPIGTTSDDLARLDSADAYGLAGHVHPGLTLMGRGLQRETLPCFIIGQSGALVPAFGSFTGFGSV